MNGVTETENMLNIFDSETKKWIEITHEQQQLAFYVEQQISAGVFISAVALKKIKDEKLYLARGARNFEEYVITLPFGRSTAFNYLKVANRFESVLPAQLLDGKVHDMDSEGKSPTVGLLDDENTETSPIQGFSYKKLLEMAKLDDDHLKELLKTGSVTINDSEITLDDIKDMSARDTAREVKKIKDQYREKVDTLSEEVKLVNDQKKALEDTIESNAARMEAAEEKEALFGGKASMYDHKLKTMNNAEKSLSEFKRYMGGANISVEDAENLQKKFVDMIKDVGDVHLYLMDSYQEVTVRF